MFSPLEEIKSKLDIVEVISGYLKLTKSGQNYKANCPFHKEKTPSFMVSPARQIWHCFGCSTGGDIFGFVMKIENIEFSAALKMLAEKAGVKLIPENPAVASQKNRILAVNESALLFFQKELKNNLEALAYLNKRGLKDTTIRDFGLGFAPDSWHSLLDDLLKEGHKIGDIELSGLVIRKDQPTQFSQNVNDKVSINDYHDRFRSRIMFPIRDISGSAVGFTGRIFQGQKPLITVKNIDEVGKYVNTPQTLVYDKGHILYGLDKTKNDLRQAGEAVLVEGQMDFLAAYQNGLKNVVASSGTALTPYQLTILKRHANKLILGYDMDEAGQIATERSINLALSQGLELKVLKLEQVKDIADLVLTNPEKLHELVKASQPIMEFYFERAQKQGDTEKVEGKKTICSYFLPKIKNLVNAIDREYWLEKLSQYVKINQKVLEEELAKIKTETVIIEASETKDPKIVSDQPIADNIYHFLSENVLTRRQILSQRVFSLGLQNPDLLDLVLTLKPYLSEEVNYLMSKIRKEDTWILKKEELKSLNLSLEETARLDFFFLKGDFELELLDHLEIDPEEEIKSHLKDIKNEFIKEQMEKLNMEIKACENSPDKEKMVKLIDDFQKLSQDLTKE